MTRNMRNNDAATARNLAKNTTLGTMNTAADARMGTVDTRMGVAARARRSKGFGLSMSTVAALLLAAAFAMPAAAGGRDRADADIESLDAVLRLSSIGAELIVRYDIEVEDARYGDRFDLLLEIEQSDGLVLDASGRPVLMVVPLGSPSDVDDDELEFEDTVTLSVPAPRDLAKLRNTRIIATVVRAGSDIPLDSERESLRIEFRDTRDTWGEWRPLPEFGEVREVSTGTSVRHTTAVRRTTTTTRHTTVTRPGTVRIGVGVSTGCDAPRPCDVRRPHEPRRETTTVGRTVCDTRGRDGGRDARRTGETRRPHEARGADRNTRDTRRSDDGRDFRRAGGSRETHRSTDNRRAGSSRDTRRETTSTRRVAENTRSTQHTRTARR